MSFKMTYETKLEIISQNVFFLSLRTTNSNKYS